MVGLEVGEKVESACSGSVVVLAMVFGTERHRCPRVVGAFTAQRAVDQVRGVAVALVSSADDAGAFADAGALLGAGWADRPAFRLGGCVTWLGVTCRYVTDGLARCVAVGGAVAGGCVAGVVVPRLAVAALATTERSHGCLCSSPNRIRTFS